MVLAQEILERITSLMSLDSKVSASKKDDDILLNIEGDHAGILIGYKGRTLDALEFIVNKAVNKTAQKKVRVILDSENYKQRREDALQRRALKLGEQAKRTGKAITINALNPHDRRIIHLALKGDPQVQTRSDGEGLLKKVHIIPNRKKTNENQSD